MSGKENLKLFAVRLPVEQHEQIVLAEQLLGQSPSEIVRQAVEAGLSQLLMLNVSPEQQLTLVKDGAVKRAAMLKKLEELKQSILEMTSEANTLESEIAKTDRILALFSK